MKSILNLSTAYLLVSRSRFATYLYALLLLCALGLWSGTANAAPLTYMASVKGINSAVLPNHQAGDILIAWAIRDGSSKPPTVPSGWTQVSSTTACCNALGFALAWKRALTNNETVGSFTGATSLIVSQYRPGTGYTVSVGAYATAGSGSSLTANYPALALEAINGSSWVLGFFGHSSPNIGSLNSAPAGMTNRATDQDATDSVAIHDTASNVSSWPARSVVHTGTSASIRTAVLELKITPPAGNNTWQLDTGHYKPRLTDMMIVHPRPDSETGAHAQHRNAYPGIPWTTHVDVIGGSYPFKFELAGNVPTGMTIGGQLAVSGDTLDAPDNYGVISWPNPIPGQYLITVNVYDQEYQRGTSPSALTSIMFNLVVGTSRFVFIDPVNGSDSNAGTLNTPLRSIYALHNGSSDTNTFSGRNVYLRGGTHNLDGMSTNFNNYAMFSGKAPNVFIGYPGENAVISAYQGHFRGRGATDFMLKDLIMEHANGLGVDQRFFAGIEPQQRNSFHNVMFRNYQMGSTEGENPSLVFYAAAGPGASPHSHISFNHCEFTGDMGAISTTYGVRYFSFQHNRIHGIDTTNNYSPTNGWGFLYFKDSTSDVDVRANDIWENNNIQFFSSFAAIGGQNSNQMQFAYNNIRFSYNKIGDLQHAFLGVYEGGSTATGAVYGFRNSTSTRVADYVQSNPPVINQWTSNVVEQGFHNMTVNFSEVDNHTGITVLDNQLKLTGSYRTQYLGLIGAEVR